LQRLALIDHNYRSRALTSTSDRPILFLAFANDRDRYLRNLPEEAKRLRAVLDRPALAARYTVEVRENVRRDELLDFFQDARHRNRIVLFHFAGHADDDYLLWDTPSGQGAPASAAAFAAFLASQANLRLVFLNGCSTVAQVQGLLNAGVQVIIATDRAISDAVAVDFAARFYSGLAGGATVQEAFNEAAADIQMTVPSASRAYKVGDNAEMPEHTHWPWAIHTRPGAESMLAWRLLDVSGPKDAIDSLLPAGKATDFYTCFISYSSNDEEFAQRLHADLQANGIRCWFAPEDIAGGKKLHEQIDQAIRLYDKLLLVLSDTSIQSEWVMTEIRKARRQEVAEQRRKLFPIRLVDIATLRAWECFDADTGKDQAVEVREYFIPDFSHWKDHDAYQKAFDRLLRDLKGYQRDSRVNTR
jgi:hypothetical protein